MNNFFLNFTKILEANSKVYWIIILGIVACLFLYIIEIFHIQNILTHLEGESSQTIRAHIEPLTQGYQWTRIVLVFIALYCSHFQYRKTKKALDLL